MTKRLLAIVALVAWLSTGCFTLLGMATDQTARSPRTRTTKREPGITDGNGGTVFGMVLDAAVIGLSLYALSHSNLGWGCDSDCTSD
jgi:hypothetical protein